MYDTKQQVDELFNGVSVVLPDNLRSRFAGYFEARREYELNPTIEKEDLMFVERASAVAALKALYDRKKITLRQYRSLERGLNK